jgi:branched-chain amino acid transport system substrate-binding protein
MELRRWVLFPVLALVLALGAAACGDDEESSSDTAAATPTSAAAEPTTAAAEEPAASSTEAAPATDAATDSAATGEVVAPSGDPILIGIAAAKTGIISPFDIEPAQAFELAIEEINAAGGILGRPVTTEWVDTKSDPALAASIADELIGKGAVAVLATCDFDFGSPAATSANAKEVIGFSLCASDPKFADTTTIGPYAFTMGSGTDVKGSASGEWAYNVKGWRKAYLLQDELLEYTKSLGQYWKQRFTDLGGEIVGEDKFTGNEALDPSPNVSRLRDAAGDADVIVLPSVVPAAATMLRAIRDAGIDTPVFMPGAAVDGTLVTGAIPDISNFYSEPYACMPAYCTGEDNPKLVEFTDKFEAKYGNQPTLSYPVAAYDLATVLKMAMESAGSTDGPAVKTAIETMPETEMLSGSIKFSATCHKPIRRPMAFVEYQNGKGMFIERYRVEQIADVGDNNPCAKE